MDEFLLGKSVYILNTPNVVSGTGLFKEALRLRANTFLVSAGSITPSSHNLKKKTKSALK